MSRASEPALSVYLYHSIESATPFSPICNNASCPSVLSLRSRLIQKLRIGFRSCVSPLVTYQHPHQTIPKITGSTHLTLTYLLLVHLSRPLPFPSNHQQLSPEHKWAADFSARARCDRGPEAGIQCPRTVSFPGTSPSSSTRAIRAVGRVAGF